jgi:hypothetical protein
MKHDDIPALNDESVELSKQFPELALLFKLKAQLQQRRAEGEKRYRDLTQRKICGSRTINDQATNIARVMNHEDIPLEAGVDGLLNNIAAQTSALDDAIHLTEAKIRLEKVAASRHVCERLLPEHDKAMKRLCAGLLEAHTAYAELWQIERALKNKGIGLYGICSNLPAFFDSPNDKASDLASFFRQAVADRHLSAVPKELR